MKRLVLLLVLLLAAPALDAQTVGASQIRKKTNGGLVADSANALAVTVPRGTTAPANPLTGQTWCDTNYDPCVLKVYSGSAWTAQPSAAALTQDDLTSFPATPSDGQILWLKAQRRAVVYDATAAAWYYLDNPSTPVTATYSLETVGYAATMSVPGATTGSVAASGSVTVGTHVCVTTIYNSTGGETTPGTATGTLTATSGQQTLSLTIPTGGTGTRGRRVWCSKTNTTRPLFLVATVDDNTTTAASVTVADSAYGAATVPDINFSGALPSGWVFYTPDISYGGCGSTGSSLLCAAYTAASNAATSSGIRLYYEATASTAAWRVEWRVKRISHGFLDASTTHPSSAPLAVAASDGTSVAPAMFALCAYQAAADVSPAQGIGVRRATRSASAAWSAASGENDVWPTIKSFPMYVRGEGRIQSPYYPVIWFLSGDGVNYTDPASASSAYNDLCSIGLCPSVELRYLGIALERNGTAVVTGGVYEFDGFTWKSL